MVNAGYYRSKYPLFLKLLLGIGTVFLGSLGLLVLSQMLNMFGFAFGIQTILDIVPLMEQVGISLMFISVMLGGIVSSIGLITRSSMLSKEFGEHSGQQKNESQYYDIRDHGITVEDVLSDMTMREWELLAEKLAESRLSIREDGTLIPSEQAEKLNKIERFLDG